MSDVPVRDFLKARRDRALGSVLGYVERTFQHKLSSQEWEDFRYATIDAINSYHDSILDLVKSETFERNDEALKLLRHINSQLGS